MEGKICVVTGANSGIGLETARALGEMGAHVVMVCRNLARAERAREDITSTAKGPIDIVQADLASLASVRTASEQLLETYPSVDVFVSNAGLFSLAPARSADDLEMTFAVNHLAPFLMTNLLLERLRASRARIVVVSSIAHYGTSLPEEPARERSRGWRAYRVSKLANVLFTYALTRRLDGTGATANCLHPGLVRSRFAGTRRLPFSPMWLAYPFTISAREGAQTSIYLATSPEVGGTTGEYFDSRRSVASSRQSYDLDEQERLWELSARVVGLDTNGA